MMMAAPAALPISDNVTSWLISFLETHFREPKDLSLIPSLIARLQQERADLEGELLHLKKRLSLAVSSWISRSSEVGRILEGIESGPPSLFRDGSVRSHGRILSVELPLLAKEVGRIQSVRLYAETALHLETLVGDLEDATLSMMKHVSKNKFESELSRTSNQTVAQDETGCRLAKLLVAVKTMNDIEEVLAGVANSRPWWTNLLKAVDYRVEKALAVLRPQCLSDYRFLITSLGWPPSLLTTNVEKDDFLEMPNPFFLMEGEMKDKYYRSFLALCSLQHLQAKREARLSFLLRNQTAYTASNVKDSGEVPFFKYGLWPIDELVRPIAFRMEYHFSRWLDQPKFIFALVYKSTRFFLDGVDNILQPLIDNARLKGCSAKEAWVVAMVRMLLGYLERHVFPILARNHSNMDGNLDVASSLLHMVDLMITFDKRMWILIASGTHLIESFAAIEGFAPSLSVISLFKMHPDWLQMWAEMEVKDAEGKLKAWVEDERYWLAVFSQQTEYTCVREKSFIFSSREDYKAPLIADLIVRLAWTMIERGLALSCSQARNQFISSSANLFLNNFFSTLLQRSKDVEFFSTISDDAHLLRVCSAINIAQYCEHVLNEWSEDLHFMEMGVSGDNAKTIPDQHLQNSLFEDQLVLLLKLQTDCLEEIVTALLIQFDNLCWNYIQDSDQWEIKQVDFDYSVLDDDYLHISPSFIEALDLLNDRIQFLRLHLNNQVFVDLWRSIAGGLDHFIFASIPMSNARFSSMGVNQFRTDMKALFLIFKPFCVRPEAFFPLTSNSLQLLEIYEKDADRVLKLLSQGHTKSEECLRLKGLFHVSPGQAEKVLRNRLLRG